MGQRRGEHKAHCFCVFSIFLNESHWGKK
jgi:hypothetical protein